MYLCITYSSGINTFILCIDIYRKQLHTHTHTHTHTHYMYTIQAKYMCRLTSSLTFIIHCKKISFSLFCTLVYTRSFMKMS